MAKQVEDRVAPIVFTISGGERQGEKYTLDFNRDSAKFAEHRGVRVSNPENMDTSTVEELFYCSFRAHHMKISKADADDIMNEAFDKKGMPLTWLSRLIELFTQAGLGSVIDFANSEAKNSNVTVEM